MSSSSNNRAFLSNIAKLASSTTAAQIIALLSNVALTRLYSPDAFGVAAFAASTAASLAVFSTLRYQFAIVTTNTRIEKIRLVQLALSLAAISFIVFLTILPLLWYTNALPSDIPISVALLIPVLALSTSVVSILTNYQNSQNGYNSIAKSTITQSTARAGTSILTGIKWPTGLSLTLAQTLSTALSIIPLIKDSKILRHLFLSETQNINKLRETARKHSKFPKFDLWADLLNTTSANSPIFLATILFDSATSGLISLSQRVISLPVSVIAQATGQVFYKRANDLKDTPEQLSQLTQKTYRSLSAISIPLTVVLLLFGENLFAIVFGENWARAGLLSQYLITATAYQLIAAPLSALVWVCNKQEFSLYFSIILYIQRVGSFTIPILIGSSLETTILVYSISGSIVWYLYSLYLLSLTKSTTPLNCLASLPPIILLLINIV
ncbi:oligosaccharide flippase family protein [Pelagicoccus sp. SDUM812005]|uniref:oligosaccharide flippase family protein n=1 Tax=Pelagicoccus sp. SDUM812005 TaxID=3041257 RepID=UPI00280E6D0E|nr:oligosaccharide flippase family protein [Pelagicoccus sp. SDUM812005]MDQ8180812.1 oligosaccharide flippase family protein [Pelagicoccus sp. SDUM812005]